MAQLQCRDRDSRLRADELDAADLEAEFLPTLRRSSGLIARALGRTGVPDWMRLRQVDGSLQIGELTIGASTLRHIRARVLWDVGRVELDNLQATLDQAKIVGRLGINLRGSVPVYRFSGKVKSLAQAKDFTNSPSLKETMKKIGVISPPDIAFLKLVEQKSY